MMVWNDKVLLLENNGKVILSEFIENNLNKLGFCNVKNEGFIEYFLTKDIFKIFGKDAFESYELDINTIFEHEPDFTKNISDKRKKRKLQIQYGDIRYTIYTNLEGNSLEMKANNSSNCFKITTVGNKIYNSVTTFSEIETVCEYQCVSLEDEPCFDYQKIIYTNSGEEIISPVYRAKSIGVKKENNNLFEIIDFGNSFSNIIKNENTFSKLEKVRSVLRKYIISMKRKSEIVSIPYSNDNIYISISNIFEVLEEKCSKEYVRTLKK